MNYEFYISYHKGLVHIVLPTIMAALLPSNQHGQKGLITLKGMSQHQWSCYWNTDERNKHSSV